MKELSHLNKYFFRYRYRFFLGIVFVVASNLFSVFPAKSVQRAIDELTQVIAVQRTSGVPLDQIAIGKIVLWCSFLVLIFALVRGLFMFLMRQSLIVMSRKIEFDLKNEIYEHYQKLDQAFYRNNSTGDMMARIGEDVSRVRMYIGPSIMYFTNLIATFLVVLPAMFSVSAKLAIWVLLPLPVLSFCIFYVHNIINRRSDAIQRQLSVLTSFTQEAYNGIRVIKAFGAESYSREAFANDVKIFRERSMDMAKVDATFFPLMVFLTGLSTVITIFVGGTMAINNEITVGNIAEYVFYVNLLIWPVTALGFTTSLTQRAAASQKRINAFLTTVPAIDDAVGEEAAFNSSIRFEKVSFTYPGKNTKAIDQVSFECKKGTTIGIIGATGSGKSTLGQLLMRQMDLDEGQILIDETPLNKLNLGKFRNLIGYVPQDVFLFSDTVINNILFGKQASISKDDALVKEVIEDAALSEVMNELPQGGETLIGERGIMLSGGQKQRVSMARALLREADILLLDDCLSAVDTRTEAHILNRLKRHKINRTIIMISHRVSTVSGADQIVVLQEGRVAETGNHQQLMLAQGLYHQLYTRQIAEERAIEEANVTK